MSVCIALGCIDLNALTLIIFSAVVISAAAFFIAPRRAMVESFEEAQSLTLAVSDRQICVNSVADATNVCFDVSLDSRSTMYSGEAGGDEEEDDMMSILRILFLMMMNRFRLSGWF